MGYSKVPLTPSVVNSYIKQILEKDLSLAKLYIIGEVSNVKYHSNGNIYFQIKDKSAQISCIMFKRYQEKMNFKLEEGTEIELIGSVYLYQKMGQYNINVSKIRQLGIGDLYTKYLELKDNFEKKGYFDVKNKKVIPKFPKKIGIITASTGAAVRDIITTIKRRYPIGEITILSTLVQGTGSINSICENIEKANKMNFDVLILGRGGGSIEDLWAFNEEKVVISIFESNIPIISAVGHETDFTIADFVSDMRAPTPTAAAELATPKLSDIKKNLSSSLTQITNKMQGIIKFNQQKLRIIENNQYYQNPLLNLTISFDNLEKELSKNLYVFNEIIKSKNKELINFKKVIELNILDKIETNKKSAESLKKQMENLNPLSILANGYSLVYKDEKVIKNIKKINKNDIISIKLKNGKIKAKVVEVEN